MRTYAVRINRLASRHRRTPSQIYGTKVRVIAQKTPTYCKHHNFAFFTMLSPQLAPTASTSTVKSMPSSYPLTADEKVSARTIVLCF